MVWACKSASSFFRSLLQSTLLCAAIAGPGMADAQAPTAFSGTTNVGATSTPIAVTVTVRNAGVSSSLRAVTQGIASADFSLVSGTCAEGVTYTVGQQCTVNVTFQPKAPGLRAGAVLLLAADGTTLGSTLLSGAAMGGLPVLQQGRIDTVIGSGQWIYRGDGVAANTAPIFLPMGVFVDAAGNMFVSDSNNNRVRRVDAATGLIATIAGNGLPGYSGDGQAATQAMVSQPAALTLDGTGNIFFADNGNHCVRRVDAINNVITTVAGRVRGAGLYGRRRTSEVREAVAARRPGL